LPPLRFGSGGGGGEEEAIECCEEGATRETESDQKKRDGPESWRVKSDEGERGTRHEVKDKIEIWKE